MKNEKYEKYIAELEQEIELLREANTTISERNAIEVATHLKTREDIFKGLSRFLTHMYTQLGQLQKEIMGNMSTVNDALFDTSQQRSKVVQNELLRLMGADKEGKK